MNSLEGHNEEPALLLGVDGEEEGDTKRSWMVTDDDDLAEDSGADLIIQQVDVSDEELQWNRTKVCVCLCVCRCVTIFEVFVF